MKEINSNGFTDIISQAIEEMKAQMGNNFSLSQINLAELTQGTVLCAESNPEFLLSQHKVIFVISEENRTISHNTENRLLCYIQRFTCCENKPRPTSVPFLLNSNSTFFMLCYRLRR